MIEPETVFALAPNDPSSGFTYPVAQCDHEEGSAIAGGVIVRVGEIQDLEGPARSCAAL